MEGNNIMQQRIEKLEDLYTQCLTELASIGIDMNNKELIGNIDIQLDRKSVV